MWIGFPLDIPLRANVQYPLSTYHLECTYDSAILSYNGFTQSSLHNSAVVGHDMEAGVVIIVAVGHTGGGDTSGITGRDVLLGTLSFTVVADPDGTHPGALSGRVVDFVNIGTNPWVQNKPIAFHNGLGGYVTSLSL